MSLLAVGVRASQIPNIKLVISLIKHCNTIMLILSPTILLYMQTTEKKISLHTVNKPDRDLMKTNVNEYKSILKEILQTKLKGECLLSTASQQKANDHIIQCT